MKQSGISSPAGARWMIILCVALSAVMIGGGLLLQRYFQRHAGMEAFRQQSNLVAQMLHDQITATHAGGAVRSLGICNIRLKAVISGMLPVDCPSLLDSFTRLRNRIGADIVYAMNAEGRVVISTRYDGDKSLTGNAYTFRPYFHSALDGNPSVYPALGITTLLRGLYYSAPVYADDQAPGNNSPIIGVIVIKMPLAAVDDLFTHSTDITALVSPHGIIFASSVPSWQLQSIPSLNRVPMPNNPETTNPEYGTGFFRSRSFPVPLHLNGGNAVWKGKQYALRTLPIPLNDPAGEWTLMLLRDTAAWFPVAQSLLNVMILLALCLAVTAASYARRRHRLTEADKVKALLEAAQTYQSIFNCATEALFVHHEESGKILEANDSARKLYEYSDADLAALSLDGAFPYPPSVARPALKAARESRTQIITFQSESKSGRSFWAQATFRAYTLHGTVRILANVHDITEQRTVHSALASSKEMLEREVELRTAQFLQAQKMAAIGKFAERVTHDVTNAMTRIIGYADIIRQKPSVPEVRNPSLDEISRAAQEMCDLSAELLAFSHPVPLKLVPMNLCRVVQGVEKIIRTSAPPGVEIVIHTPRTPLRVNLSANHIEQVLANLALNSFEAMKDGGTLTITLRRGESDDHPLSGDDHQPHPEDMALIEASDTGPGFPMASIPNVFDPFFTTKTDSKRRGMGLTTVYIIISSHHGWVNVLPASGNGGGNVQIWLPLIDHGHNP
jgi:PAS domain S-box-containing protein